MKRTSTTKRILSLMLAVLFAFSMLTTAAAETLPEPFIEDNSEIINEEQGESSLDSSGEDEYDEENDLDVPAGVAFDGAESAEEYFGQEDVFSVFSNPILLSSTTNTNSRGALNLSGSSVRYKNTSNTTVDGSLSGNITDTSEGWEWYANGATIDGKTYTGKVLVLAGANIDGGTSASGITTPSGLTTVVLKENTVTNVRSGYKHSSSNSGAIYSTGSITFDGVGFLYATAYGSGGSGNTNGNNGISVGGSITVNNGSITSVGTYGHSGFAASSITVNNGTIVATGGQNATSSGNGGGSGFWASSIRLNGGMITGRYKSGTGGKTMNTTPALSGVVAEKVNVTEGGYVVSTYRASSYKIPVTLVGNGGTFTGGGSSKITEINYNSSLTISTLERPTNSGMIFKGWFTDSACTVAAPASMTVTAPVILYAGWMGQNISAQITSGSVVPVGSNSVVTATATAIGIDTGSFSFQWCDASGNAVADPAGITQSLTPTGPSAAITINVSDTADWGDYHFMVSYGGVDSDVLSFKVADILNTTSEDYYTDSNNVMSWKQTGSNFDIHGFFNNKWNRSTYANKGYATYLKIGSGSTTYPVPFIKDGSTTVQNLDIGIDLRFRSDGRVIEVIYNVTNPTSNPITFSLGSGTDVQVGATDSAPIYKFEADPKPLGFKMLSTSSSDLDPDQGYLQFNFFARGVPHTSPYPDGVDHFWYGKYTGGSDMNKWAFNDESTCLDPDVVGNYDSSMGYHWAGKTLAAGESGSYSVMFGIGGEDSEQAGGVFVCPLEIELDEDASDAPIVEGIGGLLEYDILLKGSEGSLKEDYTLVWTDASGNEIAAPPAREFIIDTSAADTKGLTVAVAGPMTAGDYHFVIEYYDSANGTDPDTETSTSEVISFTVDSPETSGYWDGDEYTSSKIYNGSFEAPDKTNTNLFPSNTDPVENNMPGLVWESTLAGMEFVNLDHTTDVTDTPDGAQFAELRADYGEIYQDFTTTPGDVIEWSVYHKGLNGPDTLSVSLGAAGSLSVSKPVSVSDSTIGEINIDGTVTTDKDDWVKYTGYYVVPDFQTTTRIQFKGINASPSGGGVAVANANYGNLIDQVNIRTAMSVPRIVTNGTTAEVTMYYPNDDPSNEAELEVDINGGGYNDLDVERDGDYLTGTVSFTSAGSYVVSVRNKLLPEYVASTTVVVPKAVGSQLVNIQTTPALPQTVSGTELNLVLRPDLTYSLPDKIVLVKADGSTEDVIGDTADGSAGSNWYNKSNGKLHIEGITDIMDVKGTAFKVIVTSAGDRKVTYGTGGEVKLTVTLQGIEVGNPNLYKLKWFDANGNPVAKPAGVTSLHELGGADDPDNSVIITITTPRSLPVNTYYFAVEYLGITSTIYDLEVLPINENAGWTDGGKTYEPAELKNGSFELPSKLDTSKYPNHRVPMGSPGLEWKTTGMLSATRPDDIEIVNVRHAGSGYFPTGSSTTPDGTQFAELNCEAIGNLYQDIETTPGEVIQWSLYHRGRFGDDTMAVDFGPSDDPENLERQTPIKLSTGANGAIVNTNQIKTGNSSWVQYGGVYVVPAGQYKTRFQFTSITTNNEGNPALTNKVGNLLDQIEFTTLLSTPSIIQNGAAADIKAHCVEEGAKLFARVEMIDGDDLILIDDFYELETTRDGNYLLSSIPFENAGVYLVTVYIEGHEDYKATGIVEITCAIGGEFVGVTPSTLLPHDFTGEIPAYDFETVISANAKYILPDDITVGGDTITGAGNDGIPTVVYYNNVSGKINVPNIQKPTSIVAIGVSTDATLKEVEMNVGRLNPVLIDGTFDYKINVPNQFDSITLNPIPNHEKATITSIEVDGNLVNAGEFTLDSMPENKIYNVVVLITAENGNTETYTIAVKRSKAAEGGNLGNLDDGRSDQDIQDDLDDIFGEDNVVYESAPKKITLQGDIYLPDSVIINNDLEIDLNGFTIKGADGKDLPNGGEDGVTPIIITSNSNVTIEGPGVIIGGNGGDATVDGDGGNGADGITTTGDGTPKGTLTITGGADIKAGNGGNGAGSNGNGGKGGNGITNPNGDTDIKEDSEIDGGDGGDGSGDGDGGDGGNGVESETGDTDNKGNVNGGDGGDALGGGNGGNGGNGTQTDTGDINNLKPGSSNGGDGGNSAGGDGGDGGNGTDNNDGNTYNDGEANGGDGGDGGSPNGGGGNGGHGANSGDGDIDNDGILDGGDGGDGGSPNGGGGNGGNGGNTGGGDIHNGDGGEASGGDGGDAPGGGDGGNGGNGLNTEGDGGIVNEGDADGGDGGDSDSGKGGDGGHGGATEDGDIINKKPNGSFNGGDGGDSEKGNGGDGGDGSNSGGGDINNEGDSSGGDGGYGGNNGGDGGDGAHTDDGDIDNDGKTDGGDGGDGGNKGGDGGNGSDSDKGDINNRPDGESSGGDGGNSEKGDGGNGGDGTHTDKGDVNNDGDSDGGDGGNGGNNGGDGGHGISTGDEDDDSDDDGKNNVTNNGGATGGNGGDGKKGNGGNGGDGINNPDGDTQNDERGEAEGGDGGNGGNNGGDGGDGIDSDKGDIHNEGDTSGGDGGDGERGDGGDGGNGMITDGGDIENLRPGKGTGGNGGNGGNNGGDGGDGAHTEDGGIDNDGDMDGGDGGDGDRGNGGDGGDGGYAGNGDINNLFPGTGGGGNGGNGGNQGGDGGDGLDSNNGDIINEGDAEGGDGGDGGRGDGGNGGDGAHSDNGDIINKKPGGNSSGGDGGDSERGNGGNGGNGLDSDYGDIDNEGEAEGGDGGDGGRQGGDGGDGINSGEGDIYNRAPTGGATGGNGGNGGFTGGNGGGALDGNVEDDSGRETDGVDGIQDDDLIPPGIDEVYGDKLSIMNSVGGEATVETLNPPDNSNVTVELVPDYGYICSGVSVIDENGNEIPCIENKDGTFTFAYTTGQFIIRGKFLANSPTATGVAEWLETTEHIPYLAGDSKGTFRPNGSLTRAETAMLFYRLLLEQDVEITESFNDVPDGSWYEEAVGVLASINVIKGYSDGSFKPGKQITRAEFVAIATRFANVLEEGKTFPDIHSGQWAYKEVVTAASYGWIKGKEDGNFYPSMTITRAEASTVVNRMLYRSADKAYVDSNTDQMTNFPDLRTTHWAYYEIMEATNEHDYKIKDGVEVWN